MTDTPIPLATKPNTVYPWVMANMAMLLLLVTNGLTTTGITAFDSSLLNEFGWSRGELKFRDLLTLVVAGLCAPFAGAMIDRFGVRRLMMLGLGMFAVLYFFYGQIQDKTHLYAIHFGFGIILVMAGINVAVILASQWFVKHRGTAVGLAVVGSSLGGIVLPPLIISLIGSYGWRNAFGIVAIIPVAFMLLTWWLVRTPAEKNTVPLGHGAPNKSAAAPSPNDLRYKEALKTRSFWALSFVAMATFYSVLAVVAHLILYVIPLGFDPKYALGLLFLPGLFSKFLFGFLADILPPKWVFRGNLFIMLIGMVLLVTFDKDLVKAAVVIVGFGWGGAYTLIQLQAINNFGLTDAGKILGTITMMDAIAGGLGIWLTGVLFDKFGNYHVAFYILCALVAAAFLMSFFVKREIKEIKQVSQGAG